MNDVFRIIQRAIRLPSGSRIGLASANARRGIFTLSEVATVAGMMGLTVKRKPGNHQEVQINGSTVVLILGKHRIMGQTFDTVEFDEIDPPTDVALIDSIKSRIRQPTTQKDTR